MMRKKVIAGLLAGALAVSMLGCGSKQAEEIPAAEETQVQRILQQKRLQRQIR